MTADNPRLCCGEHCNCSGWACGVRWSWRASGLARAREAAGYGRVVLSGNMHDGRRLLFTSPGAPCPCRSYSSPPAACQQVTELVPTSRQWVFPDGPGASGAESQPCSCSGTRGHPGQPPSLAEVDEVSPRECFTENLPGIHPIELPPRTTAFSVGFPPCAGTYLNGLTAGKFDMPGALGRVTRRSNSVTAAPPQGAG
jgi:hypothetical protein